MTNIINKQGDQVITSHPFEGLPEGNERLAKVKIAQQINALIKESNLKQKDAAILLGITQPEVSKLAKGSLSGFSFDRLYRCLHALNMDVEITITKHVESHHLSAGIQVSSPLSP